MPRTRAAEALELQMESMRERRIANDLDRVRPAGGCVNHVIAKRKSAQAQELLTPVKPVQICVGFKTLPQQIDGAENELAWNLRSIPQRYPITERRRRRPICPRARAMR